MSSQPKYSLRFNDFFAVSLNRLWNKHLTHKQLEMHRCLISTVATDALMLKHQVISIRNVYDDVVPMFTSQPSSLV